MAVVQEKPSLEALVNAPIETEMHKRNALSTVIESHNSSEKAEQPKE